MRWLRGAAVPAAVLTACASAAVAQPENIRISAPSAQPEEVTIAVNPSDPLNLVVGANLNYCAYSADGGLHWDEVELTSEFGVWGDPSVIFDPSGRAYFAHLSNPTGGFWLDRLVVQQSTDRGASWNGGVPLGARAASQQDKEWMIADFSSAPTRGNLYLTWTQFDRYASTKPADSSRILCSRSSDGGLSWAEPVRVSDRAGDCLDDDSTVQGAVPAVGPDGELYTCWSSARGLMFDRSTDGGRTFGADRFVAEQPGGWNFEIPGLQRCNGFPITLCDLSASPRRGTVYIIWSDQRNGEDNTDIFCTRSTDRGETWSPARQVNGDGARTQQFMPWAAIDGTNGDIYAVYYDRRASGGTNATDVYVARSSDGGERFTETLVSATAFTPTEGVFMGDYIGIAAHGGKAHPVWTRLDAGRTSLWTAVVTDRVGGVGAARGDRTAISIDGIRRTTFDGSLRLDLSVAASAYVRVDVVDLLGRPVRTLVSEALAAGAHSAWWDGTNMAGERLPSGPYIITVRGAGQQLARNVVLIR